MRNDHIPTPQQYIYCHIISFRLAQTNLTVRSSCPVCEKYHMCAKCEFVITNGITRTLSHHRPQCECVTKTIWTNLLLYEREETTHETRAHGIGQSIKTGRPYFGMALQRCVVLYGAYIGQTFRNMCRREERSGWFIDVEYGRWLLLDATETLCQ